MKQFFVFVLMILPALRLIAQDGGKFSPEQLKQDFDIFQQALTEAHPGMYRYTPKAYFDKEFKSISKQLNQEMTEFEFYRLLNPVVAKIKCGHTKFHRDETSGDRYIFFPTELFPLKLYFSGEQAFVLYSYNNQNTIPAGSEILSINGMRIPTIIKQLLPNVYSDGNVESAKYQQLNSGFPGYYSTFVERAKRFTVLYKDSGGQENMIQLASATLTEIANKEKATATASNGLELTYPNKNVALMRIPVFMPQRDGSNYETFLASSFEEIKQRNIRHLIIDLRDNEGGMDRWGKLLYSYLTDQPFYYYSHLSVANNGDYSFRQYASLPEEFDHLKGFIKKEGNGYVFPQHENLGLQQPQANPYDGKLYILQNGRSFSVTAEFASIVRDNNRGVFIGEESGGALAGNNSGAFAIVKLPNTGLTLGVPLLGYHMYLKNKRFSDRGVLPDHPVTHSKNDVLNKKDVVMQAALELISNGKQ